MPLYQFGWTTLPGLRGISCSGFRATRTTTPDNERGVAVEFATEAERDEFLKEIEEHFSALRFTNAADAFDTVKAWASEWGGKFRAED
jgi:hypothetical protein